MAGRRRWFLGDAKIHRRLEIDVRAGRGAMNMQSANQIHIVQSNMVLVLKDSICGCSLQTNTIVIGFVMTVKHFFKSLTYCV